MPRHRPQLDLSCSSGPREGPGERAVRGGSWGALRALGLEQVVCVCVCVRAQSVQLFLPPHGLSPARLLCPWNTPDKMLE